MNFEIIESIVNLIEENYDKEITEEFIEKVTQKPYGYSRDEFEKLENISLDKYRIRRQLSIIINNIKDTSSNINEFNMEPWGGEITFHKAFKKEFGIPPIKFIKEYDEGKLQQKIDIEYKKSKYKEDGELIERLVLTYGSEENALKYLLTLEPYVFDGLGFMFLRSGAELEYVLIRYKYATSIVGDRYYCKKIPKDFYSTHVKMLSKYYDLDKEIFIKQNKYNSSKIPPRGYIMTKRSVINRLMDEIDIIKLLDKEFAPSMIRTLWYEEIKVENMDKDIISMPNELIWGEFSQMRREILRKILFQEQGLKIFNSLEELRRDIEFNYDRYIDSQNELCIKCGYKETCREDDECRYYDELSKEEQDSWLSKPDYEPLCIEKLLSEIRELFLEGLLYLDKQIMVD